jgi:hypothetical protein
MLKFHTIGQIEKNYAFENAVATEDTFNGAFGEVVDGEFVVGADATKAIMNLEVGDEAGLGTYPIKKGTQVRVLDLEAFNGKTIEVYGDQLPDGVAVGNKLASDATGALVAGASAAPYLEVTKVIANTKGVEATIVTA